MSQGTPHPTTGQLRAACANLMVDRLQGDLNAMLARSWRLRLAMRLGRWIAAPQRTSRDIRSGIRRIVADIDDGILHGWRL